MRPNATRALLLAGILCGLIGGLFACETDLGRRRATLCRRAVVALVPAESGLKLLRAGTGSEADNARVDYLVGTRPHTALCRFTGGTELVALSTDREPLNGASLYLLKRYYLDTPDAETSDPGGS